MLSSFEKTSAGAFLLSHKLLRVHKAFALLNVFHLKNQFYKRGQCIFPFSVKSEALLEKGVLSLELKYCQAQSKV